MLQPMPKPSRSQVHVFHLDLVRFHNNLETLLSFRSRLSSSMGVGEKYMGCNHLSKFSNVYVA